MKRCNQKVAKRPRTGRRPRWQLQRQVASVHQPVKAHPMAARLQRRRQLPADFTGFIASSSSGSSGDRRAASARGDGARPQCCRRRRRGRRLLGTSAVMHLSSQWHKHILRYFAWPMVRPRVKAICDKQNTWQHLILVHSTRQ